LKIRPFNYANESNQLITSVVEKLCSNCSQASFRGDELLHPGRVTGSRRDFQEIKVTFVITSDRLDNILIARSSMDNIKLKYYTNDLLVATPFYQPEQN
jgi:hypothetical protein